MTAALDKLQVSRERMRLAMLPPPAPEPPAPRLPGDPWAQPREWVHRLREFRYVNEVVSFVETWWATHPMRPVLHVAEEAGNAVARPVAQRSPLTLVLGAAAVGAGLAWVRPWRLLFRSALFAGLVPQLASRLVSRLPLESWMSMAGSMVSRRGAAAARSNETLRTRAATAPKASHVAARERATNRPDTISSAGPIPHV